MSKKTQISRRAVLRGALAGGALATIPLPRLGAMLNSNGTAYAQSGGAIRRFGIFFVGNGFVPGPFAPLPRRTGPLGELTTQLSPFANVKSKITVVSGFDLKTGRSIGVPHGHFPGGLCGAAATPNRVYQKPSIDQVIKGGPLGNTDFGSLEVGVSNATPGVSQNIYQAVSQAGPNQPNYCEFSAREVYNRLFADGVGNQPPTEPPPEDPTVGIEKSVLDAVLEDAAALNARLGAEDRIRMESHMASIRAIEQRITTSPGVGVGAVASCAQPDNPENGNTSGDGLDGDLANTMADLVVMALACDLTRIFTFQLTKPSAHVNYGLPNGLSGDFHGICHGSGGGDDQPTVQEGVKYTMGYFAGLLERMEAIPEGGGTMLDNSSVMLSTCVSWGRTHTQYEWPCVIGGRGGLRPDGQSYHFQGGWHYRSDPSGGNFSDVLLTLANINEANLTEIGFEGGLSTQEVLGIRGPV